MRKCSRCRQDKEDEAFAFKNKAKGKRNSTCIPCHKEYTREHYKKNPRPYQVRASRDRSKDRARVKAHILDYLLTHPCVDCGETDVNVLEFDHVELVGGKAQRVSHLTSIKAFEKEIVLCQVRCANCHVRRTRAQLGTWRIPPE